jgi:hypothetical protein
MRLDRAAEAFKAMQSAFIVVPEADKGTFAVASVATGGKMMEGLSFEDASVVVEVESNRAAVIAVMKEMISPAVIRGATRQAGLLMTKQGTNKLNMNKQPAEALIAGIQQYLAIEAQHEAEEAAKVTITPGQAEQ